MTKKITIITGGQTIADLVALDVAIELKVPCGGWCPRGRMSENGRIGEQYPLIELPAGHMESIERNVIGSDGTIAITQGRPDNSAARALEFATTHGRPQLTIDAEQRSAVEAAAIAVVFIQENRIDRIHIAAGRTKSQQSLEGFVRETVEQVVKSCISYPMS